MTHRSPLKRFVVFFILLSSALSFSPTPCFSYDPSSQDIEQQRTRQTINADEAGEEKALLTHQSRCDAFCENVPTCAPVICFLTTITVLFIYLFTR